MLQPKVSIYHDTRRPKKNGLYPVKVRVHYNNSYRLYLTSTDTTKFIELSKKDFQQSYLSQKPRIEYKELKLKITEYEIKANDVIEELPNFSFEAFEKKYYRASGDGENIVWHCEQYVKKLMKEDRVKTAISYDLSMKSILSFYNKDRKEGTERTKLPFALITPVFLNQYEKWMVGKGLSLTTVGIYARSLRTIFNNAISEGVISDEVYPFGKKKFKIPAGRNIKKALAKDELKILFEYPIEEGSIRQKAKDFWFFSYQCNGMNMRDIAELKYKNYNDNSLVFIRSKTKHTTKGDSKSISVPIVDFTKKIIKKYGNKPIKLDTYIFPILNECKNETEKVRAIEGFTRFVNQHIKNIALEAGLSGDISTYWARHSFATMLKRSGANTAFIGESLGHQNEATTNSYLDSFEDTIKREYADKLMDF
jgi:integrase/recombinase XerD